MKVAFTGSFDPAHTGHKFIVDQAVRLGFEVIVIVANNASKHYQHSLKVRLDKAQEFFGESVKCYAYSLDNIGGAIKAMGCDFIVRGLRDDKDFRYEQSITEYNQRVNDIDTIYIPCPPDMRNISSSAIRGECKFAAP